MTGSERLPQPFAKREIKLPAQFHRSVPLPRTDDPEYGVPQPLPKLQIRLPAQFGMSLPVRSRAQNTLGNDEDCSGVIDLTAPSHSRTYTPVRRIEFGVDSPRPLLFLTATDSITHPEASFADPRTKRPSSC